MNDALYIAATGLEAQQSNVQTIANNLANVNTPGFKRGSVNFHDLMRHEAGAAAGGLAAPRPVGVAIAGTPKYFGAGELRRTDSPMDLAIRGDGFIEVQLADGGSAYTRGATLTVNKDGLLATTEGLVLHPSVHVGRDIQNLAVAPDGSVSGTDAGTGRSVSLGRIELANFANPAGLESLGDKLYRASEASGEAMAARAGEAGSGTFAQGFVEGSNVQLVDEMVNLMVAQRAYEMNVKVIQAADEMLGMSNNLRR
ncbi:flagellar basal-body rod protein FlgG [Rhizobacter sp. P5_C2]